jgi:pSer/pThr/pTyr-binding forkhead associated (FHA) protein
VARLVIGKPPRGKVYSLDKPVIRIGRTDEAEIRLPNAEVSREHARVFQVGQDYFVEDLGSRNGTRVNGTRVERHRLRPGEELQIGPYTLQFEADAPAVQ